MPEIHDRSSLLVLLVKHKVAKQPQNVPIARIAPAVPALLVGPLIHERQFGQQPHIPTVRVLFPLAIIDPFLFYEIVVVRVARRQRTVQRLHDLRRALLQHGGRGRLRGQQQLHDLHELLAVMHGQRFDIGENRAATAEHDEQRAQLVEILGLEVLVGAVRLENVHHADTADPEAVSLGHEDVAIVQGATGEIVGVDGLQGGEQLDGDAPEKVFEERSGARQDVLWELRRREREEL